MRTDYSPQDISSTAPLSHYKEVIISPGSLKGEGGGKMRENIKYCKLYPIIKQYFAPSYKTLAWFSTVNA